MPPQQPGNHEKVLQDLKAFVNESKILIEKVAKMRSECKEMQMALLRLFNPECIQILEVSNELSRQNNKYGNNITMMEQ